MNRLVVRFWTSFVLLAMILGSYAAVGASSAPIPEAVAKIQEHGAAMIARTVDPPAKRDFLARVLKSELAACVSA